MAQLVLDYRDGEFFMVPAKKLQQAIRSQIHDSLQVEQDLYMKEIEGEIGGLNSRDIAALLLAISLNKSPGPATMLVKNCLTRAVECQKEIEELTYVYNNLTISPDLMYKITIEQAKRFGLSPRDGAGQ